MFYAQDSEGKRIYIEDSKEDTAYFCPSCGAKLIRRFGKRNVHCFAHYLTPEKNTCCTGGEEFSPKSIAELWNEKMSRMLVRNISTGECYQIYGNGGVIDREFDKLEGDIQGYLMKKDDFGQSFRIIGERDVIQGQEEENWVLFHAEANGLANEEYRQFFRVDEKTPFKEYNNSVHYGQKYRPNKARWEAAEKPVCVQYIIQYVNEFLSGIGMKEIDDPVMDPGRIECIKNKEQYKTRDKADIVWMKFSKDGFLGVVAASDDINFDIPKSRADYDVRIIDGKGRSVWKHNSCGILLHMLGKKWDESFVLVFPLVGIPKGFNRGDIERGIGNFLISKGVPVLDYYSHNY